MRENPRRDPVLANREVEVVIKTQNGAAVEAGRNEERSQDGIEMRTLRVEKAKTRTCLVLFDIYNKVLLLVLQYELMKESAKANREGGSK